MSPAILKSVKQHVETIALNAETITLNTIYHKFNYEEILPIFESNVAGEGGGVDNVAVDSENVAAEYYDFQGRKVANPNAGIYLVKRGAKVSKEVIR